MISKFRNFLSVVARASSSTPQLLAEIRAGIENEADLINRKLDSLNAIRAGIENEADLINRKLDSLSANIRAGIENEADLINRKLDSFSANIRAGIENEADLINRKLDSFSANIRAGIENEADLINRKLDSLNANIRNADQVQIALQRIEIGLLARIGETLATKDNDHASVEAIRALRSEAQRLELALERGGEMPPRLVASNSFKATMESMPLMIDDKTFNTSHPLYDANKARNFPGRIFNADMPCSNAVYCELEPLMRDGAIPAEKWKGILDEALAEAKTVPHVEQIFERCDMIENYMRLLHERYNAHYVAGWVNLDDALFLYWLVRKLKPKVIVQTGVCNGLSASFMVLALAKNGGEGVLRAIDLPPVFDPNDPAWVVPGKVYGVVIPEGKTSGWIVPDAYRDRFVCWSGDAKELMPKLIADVDSLDMFYHDSDHTYDHMAFEFGLAKAKLRAGGLMVADDISWNASLWDFADRCGVPSYNYKGAVGVAFF